GGRALRFCRRGCLLPWLRPRALAGRGTLDGRRPLGGRRGLAVFRRRGGGGGRPLTCVPRWGLLAWLRPLALAGRRALDGRRSLSRRWGLTLDGGWPLGGRSTTLDRGGSLALVRRWGRLALPATPAALLGRRRRSRRGQALAGPPPGPRRIRTLSRVGATGAVVPTTGAALARSRVTTTTFRSTGRAPANVSRVTTVTPFATSRFL